MKILNLLFRFIGIIILVLVVLTLPVALLGRVVGNVVFSPETILGLFEENILNEDTVADLGEEIVTAGLGSEIGDSNITMDYAIDAMRGLEHDDWVNIINQVAPTDVIVDTTKEILDGVYSWLDGDSSSLVLAVDLKPWKENISRNSDEVLKLILDSLPQCTAQQTQDFTSIAKAVNPEEGFPPCRPPGSLYQDLVAETSKEAQRRMDELSDERDIAEQLSEANLDSLKQVRDQYRRARRWLNWGWLLVVLLYLIAIPMGTRSMKGFFKWAGRPLLISGAITLLLAILLLGGSSLLSFGVSGGLLSDLPQVSLPIVKGLIQGVGRAIVGPLSGLGVLQLFLGGIAWVVGFVLGKVRKPDEAMDEDIEDEISTLIISEEEEQPVEIVEDKSTGDSPPEKDDDAPTGMFG